MLMQSDELLWGGTDLKGFRGLSNNKCMKNANGNELINSKQFSVAIRN